jgi:hypothetical protein
MTRGLPEEKRRWRVLIFLAPHDSDKGRGLNRCDVMQRENAKQPLQKKIIAPEHS